MQCIEKGMTLIELTVVLLVLIALAGVAIPYVSGTGRMAMCQATDATMQAVKEAIMGGGAGAGFYGDTLGDFPKQTKAGTNYNLKYLFIQPDVAPAGWSQYNPKTAVGWRGPYFMAGRIPDSGIDGSFSSVYHPTTNTSGKVHSDINDSANAQVMDAWNRPIVLQIPYSIGVPQLNSARLVSAGPGSGINPGDAQIDTAIHNNLDASDRGDDRVLYLKNPDPLAQGNIPCAN